MRPTESVPARRWWNDPLFLTLVVLASALPLLWPDIPPLVDLPGHMARYRVQLDGGRTPWFSEWYDFRWDLIGNLGIDLLIIPMAWVFGLELGVKLIVIAIPPLTVAGLLWIAREVHGRVPPTAFFALPLAYGFPFHFGFVNFALSMGLALCAYGYWLRLARLGRLRLRAIVFVPVSVAIWVTHTFGWGVLGVLAFSGEMIRQRDLGRSWVEAWLRAGVACLALALPLLLMVLWRSAADVGGVTSDFFNWKLKWRWVEMALSDRWYWFDIMSLGLLGLVLLAALRNPAFGYSRNLAISALFLAAVYVCLPRIVFGSAYADMRLAPYVIAIALIALRPRPRLSRRAASALALASLAFFVARVAGNTVSFQLYDRDYDRELAALPYIPVGARAVTFIGGACGQRWNMHRLEHLGAMALVRRSAYTNDQWSMAGGQLLTVRNLGGRYFSHDPSEIVTTVKCPRQRWLTLDTALRRFPRDVFTHVWLIRPPAYDPASLAGLTPLWQDGTSGLYRVDGPAAALRLNGVSSPR